MPCLLPFPYVRRLPPNDPSIRNSESDCLLLQRRTTCLGAIGTKSAPVLVVSGELDDVTSPHAGHLVAKMFPNSRQYIARNAGHVASLYDGHSPPAKRIRRFLTRNTQD